MFYYTIKSSREVVFNNVPEELFPVLDGVEGLILFKNKKYRYKKVTKDQFSIYAVTDDKDLIVSSSMFNNKVSIIQDIAPKLITQLTDDVFHDLITINTHSIQDMYSLLPLDLVLEKKKTGKEQIATIGNLILNDLKEASTTFLKIIKYNSLTKAAINGIKSSIGAYSLNKKNCSLHKAVLNIVYLFLPELNEKNIRVDVEPGDKSILLDTDIFLASLIPFFENMVKYVNKNSKITIKFDNLENNKHIIVFDMVSLKIEEYEKGAIFDRFYSGKHARNCEKNGKGLGMFNVKRMLRLNGLDIEVLTNCDTTKNLQEGRMTYENNRFIFSII